MSIVSQYSDASLLKSIRSLNILYDHCVTESDDDNLLECRFKIITIIVVQQVIFKHLSITENILLINSRYVDTYLQYQYTRWNIMRHNASMYHSIVPSLLLINHNLGKS